MKKITKGFSALLLVTLLGFSTPSIAQSAGQDTTQNADRDDNDDSGKFGLAGLLGLLGLLGLRKRNDDKKYTTTNPNR